MASSDFGLESRKAGPSSRRRGGGEDSAGFVSQERVEAERAAMIASRQGRLESILDTHDDLVREMFHLEKWVTMLAYDPAMAKEDKSEVFQEYAAKYDLIAKTAVEAGPSRKTRRAQMQRVSALKRDAPPASTSAPAAAEKRSNPPAGDFFWSFLSEVKGKGKERVVEIDTAPESVSAGPRPKSSVKGKGRAVSELSRSATMPARPADSISAGPSRSRPKRAAADDRVLPSSIDDDAPLRPESISAPRKRRRTMMDTPPGRLHDAGGRRTSDGLMPAPGPSNAAPPRVSDRLRNTSHVPPTSLSQRKPSKHLPKPLRPHTTAPALVTPPSPSKITRIKLIVRPPPPTMSNPRQRPERPRHDSLRSYLSSYVSLDGQDHSPSELDERAAREAVLRDRIDTFRASGRYEALASQRDGGVVAQASSAERSTDVWSTIVSEAEDAYGDFFVDGQTAARRVAAMVKVYWESHGMRKDRERAQEERRLRLLAKAMAKMVANHWKLAVAHIRNQEKAKADAEDARMTQENLTDLLSQSGKILQTQQDDLARNDPSRSRSRSRSSSAPAIELEEEESSDDEEESEEEEEDEDDGDEDGEEEEEEDEVQDAGTADNDGGFASAILVPPKPPEAAGDGAMQVDDDEDMARSSMDPDERLLVGRHWDAQPSASAEPLVPYINGHSHGHSEPSLSEERDSISAVEDDLERSRSASSRSPSPTDAPLTSTDKQHTLPLRHALSPALTPASHAPGEISALRNHGFDHRPHPELDEPLRTTNGQDHDRAPSPQEEGSKTLSPPCSGIALDTMTDKAAPAKILIEGLPSVGEEFLDRPAPPPATSTPATGGEISPVVYDSVLQEVMAFTSAVDERRDSPHARDDTAQSPAGSDSGATDTLEEAEVPEYLKAYAAVPVKWDPEEKVKAPILLRGVLRPYQQSGLEWLASLHTNNLNGILADEMGLGKTIQTIALLAHLACDRGIWGPHLIVVPTSVLLNWEMEFKKFLPGFRTLSYHGNTKRRKELRQGWYDKQHFNVCITSYTLASRDAHIFKRKPWYYMILDEAHMIKNFKSQRWSTLLMFRSFRRLLLTGTPLQNNLTELWALLQFLMSGTNFANLKEFGEWFSNPLEKAIEMGNAYDDETMQRVSKLHTVLRPYLLRRLKRDVEKELPSKYEHLVLCPLSKRQRFLYDEFMARAHTRDALQSGVYQRIANILMQLRKVCNHPDLFEVRPIVTSFSVTRSAVADFEIKELLIRRRILASQNESVNLDLHGLRFIDQENTSQLRAIESRRLDATERLPYIHEIPGEPPPRDTRTIAGYKAFREYQQRADTIARWKHIGYLNTMRCQNVPIYGSEKLGLLRQCHRPLLPLTAVDWRSDYMETSTVVASTIQSYASRAISLSEAIEKFAFVTPAAVAADLPRFAVPAFEGVANPFMQDTAFDNSLHQATVKLQIAFPDPSLLQYDCGKLQELTRLLREKKAGGHRVLLFTQMTRILDILEIFLNFHGYLYLRLDGATKIEDRQYITERFNADSKIFCFIASSRSGGVGINLTGADTVIFYDSDFNPQMDRQCEDRAHRIGQIRDVHIYRFISRFTVEEALLRKANQKRSLDDLVIQKGEFDWRTLFNDEAALTQAMGEVEDTEDAHAAAVAAREEVVMEGADEADFGEANDAVPTTPVLDEHERLGVGVHTAGGDQEAGPDTVDARGLADETGYDDEEEEEGGTVDDYMLAFVRFDWDFFREWRL